MKFYLFAKFFQHLSMDEMLDKCVELGVEGPTALIREGFWVRPDHIAEDLPVLLQKATARGLEVKYANSPFEPEKIRDYEDDIRALKDNGIEMYRLGYMFKKDAGHPRGMQQKMRKYAEDACELSAKYGIRAIIQIHGMMYPHNASTAYPIVQGLDSRYIGIKLDYGNNCSQEGYEIPEYQIPLLGEYIGIVGCKNGAFIRTKEIETGDKGWEGVFLPAWEGQANYEKIFGLLKKEGFKGPGILCPFYDEHNFPVLFEKAKRELAYLRAVQEKA